MHPNAQLIQKFYTAFQARDAAAMGACYHQDVVFSDPVFGRLEGERAKAMWQMLCGRATDLHITCADIRAEAESGSARWEARYSFGPKRRPVHNLITADFQFQDSLIIRHTDRFNYWRWTGMALGPVGVVLGWSPFLRKAVRKDALRGLDAFLEKQKH